jgi:SnoaL-like domain
MRPSTRARPRTCWPAFADDVDWPNAWEGGRVVGRDAVAAYCERQWREIDPTVTPVSFASLADGRVAVEVDQLVRDGAGATVAAGRVWHTYALRGGLVARMDVTETPPAGA